MRINWPQIIHDIRSVESKPSYGQISERTGISKSSLFSLLHGHLPLHPTGERLIRHWQEQTHKTRDQLPIIERKLLIEPGPVTATSERAA